MRLVKDGAANRSGLGIIVRGGRREAFQFDAVSNFAGSRSSFTQYGDFGGIGKRLSAAVGNGLNFSIRHFSTGVGRPIHDGKALPSSAAAITNSNFLRSSGFACTHCCTEGASFSSKAAT